LQGSDWWPCAGHKWSVGLRALHHGAAIADGVEYEIDLHGHHAQELREAMDKWMNAARRVGGRRGPTRRPAVVTSGNGSGSGSSNGRPDLNAVRTWARGNGYSVSDRGRIARSVMDEWIAAGRPGQ
jgi:hypothetical protein